MGKGEVKGRRRSEGVREWAADAEGSWDEGGKRKGEVGMEEKNQIYLKKNGKTKWRE